MAVADAATLATATVVSTIPVRIVMVVGGPMAKAFGAGFTTALAIKGADRGIRASMMRNEDDEEEDFAAVRFG